MVITVTAACIAADYIPFVIAVMTTLATAVPTGSRETLVSAVGAIFFGQINLLVFGPILRWVLENSFHATLLTPSFAASNLTSIRRLAIAMFRLERASEVVGDFSLALEVCANFPRWRFTEGRGKSCARTFPPMKDGPGA